MYAQVVVLTYQSPEIDSYTYEVPKELEKEIKVGQLVEVPFGKRNPAGIVLSTSTEILNSKFEIRNVKKISKVILPNPILLPYQLDLLKWMKDYYLAPMVNCLNAILPELPRKLFMVHSSWKKENKTTNYKLSTINQSLILVPSLNKIAETLAKFPKAKNYVVYHNELKTSEKFAAWIKIQNGEVDYIFGSRSAIFAPCPALREIIIYDEHDSAYKDDRSPYFDTLTVAQKIAGLTGAQVKIVDPSPKITTYFQLPTNIKIQNFPQKVEIINMQNEKNSQNRSAISFDLEEAIGETLEEKGNILLFLNKVKESGHFFCKSCKTSGHQEVQPQTCPNCQSPDIFWNVLNVNSLTLETKKLFPKINVSPITKDNRRSTIDYRQSVDIGTAFSLYSPLLKKYDLVAHIQTDSVLNIADYTSAEKLFAQITSLKKLLKVDGKLFLQTYNRDNPTIGAIEKGDYKHFFNEEIKQRKLISFPPYSILAKLTIKGKNRDKIQKEAEQLATDLKSKIQDLKSSILGPYQSVFWQKTPSYHIILKYKLDSFNLDQRQKAVEKIKNILGTLPGNWQVEVEPDSIQ